MFALLLAVGCGDGGPGGSDETGTMADTIAALPDGSEGEPLRVMFTPAEGGRKDGTISEYKPLFDTITEEFNIHFTINVGESYEQVVEKMVAHEIDIAYFGPFTFYQAKQKGAAELLAVPVSEGKSVYYSGIFVLRSLGARNLQDLRGRRVAFGDINSTSSFAYPVAMLLKAGVDPIKDLDEIYITGSHADALAALASGKVDAACSSLTRFQNAVSEGLIDPFSVRLLLVSDAIPYPPMAMNAHLDSSVKTRLRHAFANVHERPGVDPEMIRGYAGTRASRYRTDLPEAKFDKAMKELSIVTDELKKAILEKAKESQGVL